MGRAKYANLMAIGILCLITRKKIKVHFSEGVDIGQRLFYTRGLQSQCDKHNVDARFSPFCYKVVSLLFLDNLNGSQIMGGNFV